MAEIPSRWSTINEFSKTVITLASALLAASITFSTQVLGDAPPQSALWLIRGAWLAFLVSVVAGLLVAANVYAYLAAHEKRSGMGPPETSESDAEDRAHRCANASYLLLAVGVVLFMISGLLATNRSDSVAVVRLAKKLMDQIAPGASFRMLRSDADGFIVEFVAPGTSSTIAVSISSDLQVVSAKSD